MNPGLKAFIALAALYLIAFSGIAGALCSALLARSWAPGYRQLYMPLMALMWLCLAIAVLAVVALLCG